MLRKRKATALPPACAVEKKRKYFGDQ